MRFWSDSLFRFFQEFIIVLVFFGGDKVRGFLCFRFFGSRGRSQVLGSCYRNKSFVVVFWRFQVLVDSLVYFGEGFQMYLDVLVECEEQFVVFYQGFYQGFFQGFYQGFWFFFFVQFIEIALWQRLGIDRSVLFCFLQWVILMRWVGFVFLFQNFGRSFKVERSQIIRVGFVFRQQYWFRRVWFQDLFLVFLGEVLICYRLFIV